MTRSFQFISFLLIALIFASCTKSNYPLKTGDVPIIPIGNIVQKFNMSLDFGGSHFNGMLIAKTMNNGEIRIVASTLFGLSLFDFGLKGEDWTVYSCIEPMRKKRVLKIFETDFKFLLLPERSVRRIEKTTNCTKLTTGGGLSKGVVCLWAATENNSEWIQIRHSWLRLTIRMEQINEENVVK